MFQFPEILLEASVGRDDGTFSTDAVSEFFESGIVF